MIQAIIKDKSSVQKAYPFLVNFPFIKDFDMELITHPVPSIITDDEFDIIPDFKVPPPTVRFKYGNGPVKADITIFENELVWIADSAENISKLDKVSKKIERGLKSTLLTVKRDSCIEAEYWLAKLTDGQKMLSQATFTDALRAMVNDKEIEEVVKVVSALNKLLTKQGFIRLTKDRHRLLLTYLHVRLIYVKLILGVVIASKLSI